MYSCRLVSSDLYCPKKGKKVEEWMLLFDGWEGMEFNQLIPFSFDIQIPCFSCAGALALAKLYRFGCIYNLFPINFERERERMRRNV